MLPRITTYISTLLLLFLTPAAMEGAAPDVYSFGPSQKEDMDRCRIFDANGDGCTWTYSADGPALLYEGNDNDADEYIFLPPVSCTVPGTYRITMQALRGMREEMIQIGFARAPSPQAMTVAGEFSSEIPSAMFSTIGTDWKCVQPGLYYPVIRIVTPRGGISLRIRDISVERMEKSGYTLPVSIVPTPAQSIDFGTKDADTDGRSWFYRPDSLCFTTFGSATRKSDDWLILPPVRIDNGHYSLSFDCRSEGSAPEIFEVLYGPDSIPMEMWSTAMTNPAATAEWRQVKALFTVDSAANVPYRTAVRLRSEGGDGLSVRNFRLETSADSLHQIPFMLNIDTTFTGKSDEWIFFPPFRPEPMRALNAVWRIRALGPASPLIELWEGPVADSAAMTRVALRTGIVNSEPRTMAQSFYYGDRRGQHVVALRIVGNENSSGGVIESLAIDTLAAPADSCLLPWAVVPDIPAGTDTFISGPVWIGNMELEMALQLDIAGNGDYTLLWGTSPDTATMKVVPPASVADTATGKRSFIVVPQDFGYHYMALISTGSHLSVDSISLHTLPYGVTTPSAPTAVSARYHHGTDRPAEVTVTLPSSLVNGNSTWPDECLVLEITTPLDTVRIPGQPGDTMTLPLHVPDGFSTITARAGNYAGYGPESICGIYAGPDAPRTSGYNAIVLPDADNKGALISWSADSVGVHGGYADPAEMCYNIELLRDTSWISVSTVTAVTDCHVRLPADIADTLSCRHFRITGANAMGKAAPTAATAMLGKAVQVPVAEDFRDTIPRWPFAFAREQSPHTSIMIDTTKGRDSELPLNGSMILRPDTVGATGCLMLPSYDSEKIVLTALTLRVSAGCGSPVVSIAAMTDNRIFPLDTVSLADIPDGFADVTVLLPDSLLQAGATTLALKAEWRDTVLKPLVITRYSIGSSPTPVVTDIAAKLTGPPAVATLVWDTPLWTSPDGRVVTPQFPVTYALYRDSIHVGTTSAHFFTDTLAATGLHTYHVACRATGAEFPLGNPGHVYVNDETLSASAMAAGGEASVIPVHGGVTVVNLAGETLTVSRTDGIMVKTLKVPSDHFTLTLQNGIYIIRCGSTVVRTAIR